MKRTLFKVGSVLVCYPGYTRSVLIFMVTWRGRNFPEEIKVKEWVPGIQQVGGAGIWTRIYLTLRAQLFPMQLTWLPRGLSGKESACNAEDVGSVPESGRPSEEGNGNPLQYPCLGNCMDRGAWRAAVHGVARVRRDLATKQRQSSRILEWELQLSADGGVSSPLAP